ncbi:MAG: hypothetical protein M3517_00375 [Actinomycetota bacterium]|nr:hypothetical protein [Actinomycetota bacterium]
MSLDVNPNPEPNTGMDCPRCGRVTSQPYYGPCERCRSELRASLTRQGVAIEVAEYEPKMNVTPNAVAQKDD